MQIDDVLRSKLSFKYLIILTKSLRISLIIIKYSELMDIGVDISIKVHCLVINIRLSNIS